jgi:hypothetical protein
MSLIDHCSRRRDDGQDGRGVKISGEAVLCNGRGVTREKSQFQNVESLKVAIQEDADDGDAIVLRAGKYVLDETLVITKSVKILGPQANVDPRPSKNSARTDDNNEAVLTGDKGNEQ